ncbi:hypothetical protein AGLY_007812 [Aphis glycines]|uniref:Uncharacterized protein n=1 Tax=Aphis glycines TaxID=307491 RepID=A0A6G0TNI7_APHGL|nr:hypothetical protein AGLY_007812 [Aphis glycines]
MFFSDSEIVFNYCYILKTDRFQGVYIVLERSKTWIIQHQESRMGIKRITRQKPQIKTNTPVVNNKLFYSNICTHALRNDTQTTHTTWSSSLPSYIIHNFSGITKKKILHFIIILIRKVKQFRNILFQGIHREHCSENPNTGNDVVQFRRRDMLCTQTRKTTNYASKHIVDSFCTLNRRFFNTHKYY